MNGPSVPVAIGWQRLRRFLTALIVACVVNVSLSVSATGGIIGSLKRAGHAIADFSTHKKTATWGFRIFMIAGRGLGDAVVDAYQFDNMQPGGAQTRIINQGNFHVWKNFRDLCTIIAGGFLGIQVGKGYRTIPQAAREFLWTACITYPTWRGNYTYARWGDWWDTSAAHTQHLVPYPNLTLHDRYVRMSGGRVTTFYSLLYATGVAGWIFDK